MASFAKLDDDNVVIEVVAVNNDVITDANGIEQESLGIEFLRNLYNEPNAKWLQTSYNTRLGVHLTGGTPLRMNYASLGGTYDPVKDIFIGTKPYSTYVGPNDDGTWSPPIPFPSVEQYTNDQNEQVRWVIEYDNDNIRWLGAKFKEAPIFDHVWNETTQTWDTL